MASRVFEILAGAFSGLQLPSIAVARVSRGTHSRASRPENMMGSYFEQTSNIKSKVFCFPGETPELATLARRERVRAIQKKLPKGSF